jgi:hypothetical protein
VKFPGKSQARLRAAKLALFAACAIAPLAALAGDAMILWKPETTALLKLNGRPVKTWNVYRAEKKKDWILVHLSHRYLLLDTKQRTVRELDPATVKPSGKNVECPEPQGQERRIESTDWVLRDIGPAELVRLKLLDYGGVLDVQLPHPYNFRVAY